MKVHFKLTLILWVIGAAITTAGTATDNSIRTFIGLVLLTVSLVRLIIINKL